MSTMRIAVFPMDSERTLGIGDFIMSFMILSKEKGVECRPTSSGAIIDGDNETLLEILDQINATSFGALANRVAISMEFDEDINEASSQSQFRLPGQLVVKRVSAEVARKRGETNIRMLHDRVVNRLDRYVK